MTTWIVRLHLHDERALHALVLRRRRAADHLMRAATHLGDAAVTVGLVLLLALGAVPGMEEAGRLAAFALAASHAAVQLLKRSVSRPRPRLPVGCASLARAPDRFSFPSGHAASSLSVALGAATALPAPAATAVVALAAVVGLSRCYLGVHYPGDVAAGWTLATLGALAGTALLG